MSLQCQNEGYGSALIDDHNLKRLGMHIVFVEYNKTFNNDRGVGMLPWIGYSSTVNILR